MSCSSVAGNPQSSIMIPTPLFIPAFKSPDLQDGRWIECQCKHTKRLIMRQPFEHGNFTTHLLNHALAPSNQMSTIRSFFQAPSARSSQRPPSRATEAIRHRAALLQQPLDTTPSACMGSLFLPVDAYIKYKLLLLSKFGLSAIDVVVVQNVGTQEINLKAASCTNKFVKQSGRQQPNSCTACFELHQKKIRFTLFKKMIPYDEAEDALHSTEISSIQIKAAQSFLRINDKFHNAEGLEIKRRILHFQTAITSNLSKHIVYLSGDSKTVPGLDLLISNFSDFYRNTLGSRERVHVGTEMHYQQLNMRCFGTACSGSSIVGTPQLDSLRRNVLFQIKDNIYRVLTVYSKTYNK
jgi:hypothetical protein